MAINPVNVSRVSQSLRTDFALENFRRTQLDLFREQNRIATGRRFVAASEDPVAATRALDLSQALARNVQFEKNLTHADAMLASADSALVEVNDLLIQANTLASQNISNLTSAEERSAVAELVAGIRVQLQTVGNRQVNGRYIFGGRATTSPPFVDALGGIGYVGDTRELVTAISEDFTTPLTVPGHVLFGALSAHIASNVDLSPRLTESTRLEDVAGATNSGIRRGQLVFNEPGEVGAFTADLSGANTIGDVIARINQAAEAAGSGLRASIGDYGLIVTPGSRPVSIHDTSTGLIASDLGILTRTPTTNIVMGASLQPRLTRLTPVSALAGGGNLDLSSGLQITNGGRTVTVDLSEAQTVQDVLNRINNSGLYVSAQINEAGTGIDVFNQVSGTSLSIGENGGTTAGDLGIRTLDRVTPVDRLNGGRGLNLDPEADDLRIVTADGTELSINLDGVETLGDVIELINASSTTAGAPVRASLSTTGNGIVLTDSSGGSGTLQVISLNQSTAAQDLGLTTLTQGENNERVGADPNPVRTVGVLTALIDLEAALRSDDTRLIGFAGQRLDEIVEEVTRTHGVIGARSQSMRQKLNQVEQAVTSTTVLLSEIQDIDYAEAITKLQAASTQLQASLQTNALLLNLSLLDFLR